MIDNPEIKKSFVCSTTHISTKDDEILTKEKVSPTCGELSVYDYEYGYRIYIGEKIDGVISDAKEIGLSAEFCHLVKIAFFFECNWLVLDCEGKTYKELPTFDWK